MKSTIIAAVAATAVSSFAGPHFLDAGFVQDPTSHHVTISYTLDEPAVVSLDVLTNGVSIGRSAVDAMDDGTFHRKVEAGLHTLTWVPHKTWVQDVFSNNSVRVQVTAWPTNAPPDWMVVDLLHPGVVRWYASPEESPWGDFTNNVACKTDYLVLKRVPAGGRHFRMGNIAAATIFPTRNTPHIVHFSQDFYMAVFMLTQYQYDRLNEETRSSRRCATATASTSTCRRTPSGNTPAGRERIQSTTTDVKRTICRLRREARSAGSLKR